MSDQTVEKNWKRINNWLKNNAPEILTSLNGPASSAEIELLENHTHSILPDDFKRGLFVHNGQNIDGPPFVNLHFLLPIDQIIEAWDLQKELLDSNNFEGIRAEEHPKVKSDLWNTGWIPFSSDYAGDYICVDLNPSISGHHGQVFLKRNDHPVRTCLARNYNSWLEKIINAMSVQSALARNSECEINIPFVEG